MNAKNMRTHLERTLVSAVGPCLTAKKITKKFVKQLVKVACIKCAFDAFCLFLNTLLHRLFLDHDIIFFLFLDNTEKIQEKFRLSFEYF